MCSPYTSRSETEYAFTVSLLIGRDPSSVICFNWSANFFVISWKRTSGGQRSRPRCHVTEKCSLLALPQGGPCVIALQRRSFPVGDPCASLGRPELSRKENSDYIQARNRGMCAMSADPINGETGMEKRSWESYQGIGGPRSCCFPWNWESVRRRRAARRAGSQSWFCGISVWPET